MSRLLSHHTLSPEHKLPLQVKSIRTSIGISNACSVFTWYWIDTKIWTQP